MIEQQRIIEKIKGLARDDKRLEGAMLYGSFALGEGDQYSDVDCILFFKDAALASVDKLAWVEQIAPVLLFYQNEFGNYETIFDSLVRAEFHFDAVKDLSQLEEWGGDVNFPSAESTILVDKTGQLTEKIQPLLRPPLTHSTLEDAQFMIDSFLNWTLYGINLLGRGEWARSAEVLVLIQDYLLRMARVLEGSGGRWLVPTKAAEIELSAESYRRFVSCTAGIDPESITAAYWSAWVWGQEMTTSLGARYDIVVAVGLIEKMENYFQTVIKS